MTAALASQPATPKTSDPLVYSGWQPQLDRYEPSLATSCSICGQMIADMEKGAEPYWITLQGKYGCGKTNLAKQTFEQAKRCNPGNPANNPIWPPPAVRSRLATYDGGRPYCLWFDERDFVDRVRRGDYELPERLTNDFLIVIDDLGSTRDPTNFASDIISRLCQNRLRSWMIFTTNLTAPELNERMDGRISSRLIRDGNKVAKITAGDYAIHRRRSA